MAIKEIVWIWIKKKYRVVHNPSGYWIVAMITMFLGINILFPITLCF